MTRPTATKRPRRGARQARVATNASSANVAADTQSLDGSWNISPKPGHSTSAAPVSTAAEGANLAAVAAQVTTVPAKRSASTT